MLDTGIDIPEVVNLVFIKLVRSKTKFWQMVGRGTRLCKDLFGPGKDKEFFYIFDYCQNLEFFSQNPETTDGALGESLGKRLFKTPAGADRRAGPPAGRHAPAVAGRAAERPAAYKATAALRADLASLLHGEVAAMNLDNFVVRPKRRLVEKYARPEAWTALPEESLAELAHEVAGLPSEQDAEDEEAKRFDLLILNLQLAVLRAEPAFQRLSDQVKAIAGLLEEKASIPMVQEQLPLIQEIQSDEWWQDVTTPMLETVRKRLRALVKLIDKQKRKPIYTDFEDQMGSEASVDLPGFAAPDSFERFRAKARAFLKQHEDHIAIHKLRMNKALTAADLAELERMLAESGVGGAQEIDRAKEESRGLGLFVRSLVGLDREAAKEALAGFLSGKTLNANQIEFVDLIVNHLTEHGVMDASLLYESPFTDLTPHGPDGLFTSTQVDELMAVLAQDTTPPPRPPPPKRGTPRNPGRPPPRKPQPPSHTPRPPPAQQEKKELKRQVRPPPPRRGRGKRLPRAAEEENPNRPVALLWSGGGGEGGGGGAWARSGFAQAERHAHVPAGLLGGGAGVGVVVGDVDGALGAHADRVLRGMLGHVGVEDAAELAQPLDGHAEAAGQEIEAAPHGGLDGIGALGGHPDGRSGLLHGQGEHGGLGNLEVLAVIAERLAAEAQHDDVDGLLPARPALGQVLAQALELVALIAPAQAHVEAPAGEQVDGGDLLGDDQRVMQRDDDHRGADADAARLVRQVQGIGHGPRQIAVAREVVLGQPHIVEAQILGGLGDLHAALVDDLGRLGRGRLQEEERAEFHGLSPSMIRGIGEAVAPA